MTGLRWAAVADASVAFQIRGSGPDVVEIPNGAGLIWADHPLTRAWPERVLEFARLTSYDSLGAGRSDPVAPGHVPTLHEKVEEAIAVMDAGGIDDAVLVAWFAAVPVALALAAAHPGRVRGLVVVNGFARLVEGDGFPAGVPSAVREDFERTVADRYGTGSMVERWLPDVADHPEVRAFMERYEQALAKRGQIAQLSRFVSALDVRDRLSTITAPVTIIHARDDRVVPSALGADLHERLDGSQLIEVPTSHHLFTVSPMVDVVLEQTRVMATGERASVGSSSLVALVMTDIVGSTERLTALRDTAWASLLADYHDRTAQTVQRFGGCRVNTTGDGLLATFRSATAAVRCATAIARAARELGIESRSAVHVGDVEQLHDDIAGLSVHITARLLDHAAPGDVVVTDVAAQAAIGAAIPMRPIGVKALRSVPGEWRLWALELDS